MWGCLLMIFGAHFLLRRSQWYLADTVFQLHFNTTRVIFQFFSSSSNNKLRIFTWSFHGNSVSASMYKLGWAFLSGWANDEGKNHSPKRNANRRRWRKLPSSTPRHFKALAHFQPRALVISYVFTFLTKGFVNSKNGEHCRCKTAPADQISTWIQ